MTKIVFFSPLTCGAYMPEIHGSDMPPDVVEVAAGVWQSLLEELAISSKKMSSRPDGHPVLIDPPPLDLDQLGEIERSWRDAHMTSTDGIVSRHRDEIEDGGATTLTAEQYAELQAYRRDLRGWPEAGGFPLAGQRPAAPEWLVSLAQ